MARAGSCGPRTEVSEITLDGRPVAAGDLIDTRAGLNLANDEMVERAVQAFYESIPENVDPSFAPRWESLCQAEPEVAELYRRGMRAALSAVVATERDHLAPSA